MGTIANNNIVMIVTCFTSNDHYSSCTGVP